MPRLSEEPARASTALPVLFWWGSALLILVIGVCIGMLAVRLSYKPAFVLQDSTAERAAAVTIDSWNSGGVTGTLKGEVRLMIGGKAVIPDGSGGFVFQDGGAIAPVTVQKALPAGVQFVASSRGKKYYPVGSSGDAGLSPANKIYFTTAEEAEKAGYTR